MRYGARRWAERLGAFVPGIAILVLASEADAQRPAFAPGAEPRVLDGEQGHVRVHYVITSVDAVPDDDADANGTPDFVEEVAELAEIAWEDLLARGFHAPVTDTGLVPGDDGGDERFDIYLRDLAAADGNFVAEACTDGPPVHCAGFFAMENDLAEFSYASRTEGISVLTSHELFHAVQAAYADDTALAWSEGTAVWNEEQTFPEQSDYDRFIPSFLSRSYRPFDRAGAGFGDPYPYGAAIWPTFLDERYGEGTVRGTWEALERAGPGADFLSAIGDANGDVLGEGETLASAWTEFSRWNLFTGERADEGRSYRAGASLGEVAIEQELSAPGVFSTSIEGLSARYVPIAAPADPDASLQISVEVDDGAVAAFFPQATSGGTIGAEIELTREEGALSARLPAEGRGFLVVTGVRRGGLPRDVTVEIGPAADEGGGGCQAARNGGGPGTLALLLAMALPGYCRPRRSRRRRSERPTEPTGRRPPRPGLGPSGTWT